MLGNSNNMLVAQSMWAETHQIKSQLHLIGEQINMALEFFCGSTISA